MPSDTLSIIIPVYNEARWLPQILQRLQDTPFCNLPVQFVVVDDASSDDSLQLVRGFQQHAQVKSSADRHWVVLQHTHNQGKGQAIRTGLQACTGSLIVIQDADLEYDPQDIATLLAPLMQQRSTVVYGSRLHPNTIAQNRPQFSRVFYTANRLLTWVTNLLYQTRLTDMETCYKAFRASTLNQLPLKANGFDIEPELTALLAQRGIPITEVPITYTGR
jgi:glycosyltransferase involved in cell wall biosynthesis